MRKPWGREHEVYKTAGSCAWELSLNADSETSMHCHTTKTVVFLVLQGHLDIETLNEVRTMAVGGALVVEPGVFHRVKTLYGATLVEVESPPNRNDIVRLEDRYGRQGKPYECGSVMTCRG